MTSVLASCLAGLRRAIGRPGMLLGLWLINFAVALPMAGVMAYSLGRSIGGTLVHERLRAGFDMEWFAEYRALARGLETTFSPTLIGGGAFFANLEDWLTGDLFRGFPGLVGVGVIYMLLWAMLLGGVLERFARPTGASGAASFIRSSGRYFLRFVRLALLSAPLYYVVYRLYATGNERLADWTRDVTTERTVLFYSLTLAAITALLLVAVHISFAYAKIATVLEDRRSMVFAALRGLAFVLSHPFQTLGLYLLFALISVVGLVLYTIMGPGVGQDTVGAVFAAFGIGQLFLFLRLTLRISLLAGQLELYQQLTGIQPVANEPAT